MAYTYNAKRPINNLLQKSKLALPKTVNQVCNLGNLGDRLLVYRSMRSNLNGLRYPKSGRS